MKIPRKTKIIFWLIVQVLIVIAIVIYSGSSFVKHTNNAPARDCLADLIHMNKGISGEIIDFVELKDSINFLRMNRLSSLIIEEVNSCYKTKEDFTLINSFEEQRRLISLIEFEDKLSRPLKNFIEMICENHGRCDEQPINGKCPNCKQWESRGNRKESDLLSRVLSINRKIDFTLKSKHK